MALRQLLLVGLGGRKEKWQIENRKVYVTAADGFSSPDFCEFSIADVPVSLTSARRTSCITFNACIMLPVRGRKLPHFVVRNRKVKTTQ